MWRCPTRKPVKTRMTHAAVHVHHSAIGVRGVKTDHWFYGLFQSAPDLIVLLLPEAASASSSLSQEAPGDVLYRFDATELKAVNHRLDGVFWPHTSERGTPEKPVVLLEVQMQSMTGFKHRLGAQSFRFLQLHPNVEHLAVVVVVPHRRLNLGPAQLPLQLQAFLDGVIWLSLEELGQQGDLDPLLTLLTLPVLPEAQLKRCTQQILVHHPELLSAVLTMLIERLPTLSTEELMVFAGIPTDQLLHTRAAQDLLDRGRQEGRQEGEAQGEARGRAAEAAAVTLRLLNRRCGTLSEATTARIQALPLEQLEHLAEALLDFSGPTDLAAWLEEHAC
jgi:predicted transposase YdaD